MKLIKMKFLAAALAAALATPVMAQSILKVTPSKDGWATVRIYEGGLASATYKDNHHQWPGATINGQWVKEGNKYCVSWKWERNCY